MASRGNLTATYLHISRVILSDVSLVKNWTFLKINSSETTNQNIIKRSYYLITMTKFRYLWMILTKIVCICKVETCQLIFYQTCLTFEKDSIIVLDSACILRMKDSSKFFPQSFLTWKNIEPKVQEIKVSIRNENPWSESRPASITKW